MTDMATSTVERLITSAQEILWERGYVGTSPKALLARAGVGQGSMYHHFTGKADLAAVAIQRSAAELRQSAETLLSGAGSPSERLRRYLLAERDALRGCRIGRLAYDPDVITDPMLRQPLDETFQWLLDRTGEVIEDAKQAGEIPAGLETRTLAAAIVAMVQGGYVLARATNSPTAFSDAINGLIALLDTAQPSHPRHKRSR